MANKTLILQVAHAVNAEGPRDALCHLQSCQLPHDPKFRRLGRTPICDGWTDGQTHDDSPYRASKASRGKNDTEITTTTTTC